MENYQLTELTGEEMHMIYGGGIVYDVWKAIGYFIGGVVEGAIVREQSGSYGISGAHL